MIFAPNNNKIGCKYNNNLLYMVRKVHYSFKKGCSKIPKGKFQEANVKLMEACGCSTLQAYYNKRKDYVNIPAHVKEEVEYIFSKYGILDPDEIWEIWND